MILFMQRAKGSAKGNSKGNVVKNLLTQRKKKDTHKYPDR